MFISFSSRRRHFQMALNSSASFYVILWEEFSLNTFMSLLERDSFENDKFAIPIEQSS